MDGSVACGHRLVVFGGSDSSNYLNDLYTLNVEEMTWSSISADGTKPEIRGFGVVFSTVPTIVFGSLVDEEHRTLRHTMMCGRYRCVKGAELGAFSLCQIPNMLRGQSMVFAGNKTNDRLCSSCDAGYYSVLKQCCILFECKAGLSKLVGLALDGALLATGRGYRE